MSMDITTFTNKVTESCLIFYAYPNCAAELTAMATALGTDTTTHDKTIQAAPTGLQFGNASNTPFTNEILLSVNKGKAGNLTTAQMGPVLTTLAGALPVPPH